ncbi:Protocadherin-10, partial [Dissostichus eleginoides]
SLFWGPHQSCYTCKVHIINTANVTHLEKIESLRLSPISPAAMMDSSSGPLHVITVVEVDGRPSSRTLFALRKLLEKCSDTVCQPPACVLVPPPPGCADLFSNCTEECKALGHSDRCWMPSFGPSDGRQGPDYRSNLHVPGMDSVPDTE